MDGVIMAVVIVPDAELMDDETFLKHLDKRHADDTGVERVLHKSPHIQQSWVGAYRAFHEHLHDHGEYDHEHAWDDDDSDD
jgi:hypothetical protein